MYIGNFSATAKLDNDLKFSRSFLFPFALNLSDKKWMTTLQSHFSNMIIRNKYKRKSEQHHSIFMTSDCSHLNLTVVQFDKQSFGSGGLGHGADSVVAGSMPSDSTS